MSESVSILVPYRNLRKGIELETVTKHQIESGSSSSNHHSDSGDDESVTKNCSLVTLVLSCTVAAGVQFGWALQLSLLTPYIQTLGISHAFSSFIWLCGPITGLVVGLQSNFISFSALAVMLSCSSSLVLEFGLCNDSPSECEGSADVSIVGYSATDMAQELSFCEADGWKIKVDIVFPSWAKRGERCHKQYMAERKKKTTTSE